MALLYSEKVLKNMSDSQVFSINLSFLMTKSLKQKQTNTEPVECTLMILVIGVAMMQAGEASVSLKISGILS